MFKVKWSMVIVALLLMAACDKVPINGDLDGMWQLMSIETPEGKVDAKPRRVYMSVQLHLTQWNNLLANRTFFARFTHRGDSIRFYDFVKSSGHNSLITPADVATENGLLNEWGIHSVDASYHIDRLTDSSLILHDNDTILTFRKF